MVSNSAACRVESPNCTLVVFIAASGAVSQAPVRMSTATGCGTERACAGAVGWGGRGWAPVWRSSVLLARHPLHPGRLRLPPRSRRRCATRAPPRPRSPPRPPHPPPLPCSAPRPANRLADVNEIAVLALAAPQFASLARDQRLVA